jgi:hypothetical protein
MAAPKGRIITGAMFALATFVGPVAPRRAESFVDLFAGRSFPDHTPVALTANEARIDGQILPAALRVDLARVRPTDSTIYGVRIGHWFGRHAGLALDVATLDPDIAAQTVRATANLRFDESVFGEEVVIDPGESRDVAIPRVTIPTTATIAALAMARFPIGVTAARPAGMAAPYAFAGPVWLITDTSLDGNLGIRAGGGLRLPIARRLALFGEYRFTHANADTVAGRVGGEVRDIRGTSGDIRADMRIRNHNAVGGISLSF